MTRLGHQSYWSIYPQSQYDWSTFLPKFSNLHVTERDSMGAVDWLRSSLFFKRDSLWPRMARARGLIHTVTHWVRARARNLKKNKKILALGIKN